MFLASAAVVASFEALCSSCSENQLVFALFDAFGSASGLSFGSASARASDSTSGLSFVLEFVFVELDFAFAVVVVTFEAEKRFAECFA